MNKDILSMVKGVATINIIIGIILTVIVQIIFKRYGLFVLVGMIIAILNFFINCVLSDFVTTKLQHISAIFYTANFILRVVLAAGIGYLIFEYNKYNLAAYLFGYTSHIVGLYIYTSFKNSHNNL
ncbi:ATP synthase subunit I [Clostridium fermenticellae]|uniref:ATP synthase subunit I n=1 Tax=Clostridium fermenticellae TaxID=2068654 RepID=A0A386H0I8_9CLOT|nr:ATP synthase subunit I [Clostridium fermenticellae]AYD39197.1 ATP synthase subunit I [Clostridium fermenticellae]